MQRMNAVGKPASQLIHSSCNVRHGPFTLQQVSHDEDVPEDVAFTLLD
jgi:hypothetical protein